MADRYDQTSLVEFASGKDPAMVNAVEIPPVSRTTGESGIAQRTEARSHLRNDIPIKRGKACGTLKGASLSDAGDGGRKNGRTQEFLTVCKRL
ncbi:MAG: hypothetical protein P1Q69_04770 [Candidatus Thorarchaeota archaeon]|nr:hypothetical protein [Candidatus Thorarchaeota archaeon]